MNSTIPTKYGLYIPGSRTFLVIENEEEFQKILKKMNHNKAEEQFDDFDHVVE